MYNIVVEVGGLQRGGKKRKNTHSWGDRANTYAKLNGSRKDH